MCQAQRVGVSLDFRHSVATFRLSYTDLFLSDHPKAASVWSGAQRERGLCSWPGARWALALVSCGSSAAGITCNPSEDHLEPVTTPNKTITEETLGV